MSKHPTLELLDTLNDGLLYVLETATCLAVFYLLYHFVLRNERSFQYNRFYLLSAVLFSLAFPLIEVDYNPEYTPSVLNSIHEVGNEVTKEPIIEPKGFTSVTVVAESERPFMLWWEVALLLYIAGFVALGLRLFIQIRSFKEFLWYRRHQTRFKDHYFLVKTEGQMPTFAFFKYLMWDDSIELSAEEKKQIMDHEKVHIKQKHSLDIMLMEVLKIFFWFNPFIYLYRSLLEEIHEYEADNKAVLANGQLAYTKLLVKLVFQKMGLNQGSHFAKNKTLKRVDMIKAQKKISWLKLLTPLPVAALLFFIFSCEAITEHAPITVADVAYIYTSFGKGDSQPAPQKGFESWKSEIAKELAYPETSPSKYREGTVMVSFLIAEDGNVKDVRLVESLGRQFDRQVVEAIRKSSKWKAGIKNGKQIATRVEVPINFSKS